MTAWLETTETDEGLLPVRILDLLVDGDGPSGLQNASELCIGRARRPPGS